MGHRHSASVADKTLSDRHIVFVCTEDWFFKSHFLPLNEAALTLGSAGRCSLITTINHERDVLDARGINLVPFDFTRQSANLFVALRQVWQLAKLLRAQKADIVHFISLRPILVGGLAACAVPDAGKVFHVTGLGTIAEGHSRGAKLFRRVAFGLVALYLRSKKSFLIVENEDDLAFLEAYGTRCDGRVGLFGGAGVDPALWPAMPETGNQPLRIAFVGRMIWTKGVDVLIDAMNLLYDRGVDIHLDLYGEPDPANPKSFSQANLQAWDDLPNVTWHGRSQDVQGVWRSADISVIPTRTREGMPRAMLEAAACARPQVVTDVPGPRQFVRDGVEGMIVPPESAESLAEALAAIAADPDLRQKMGRAARQRILDGFTQEHVCRKTQEIYQSILRDH